MAVLLRFFGGYFVELEGAPAMPLTPQRTTWLLLYLAVQGSWVKREELQLLFWPDSHNSAQALRQVLYRTKQMGLEAALESGPLGLRFKANADLHEFTQAFESGRFGDAYSVYHGELGAQDAAAHEAPEFTAWLDLERLQWRHRFIEVAKRHAFELRRSQPEAASTVLESALKHDPLNEPVLLQLLELAELHGLNHQGQKALRVFAHHLQIDLGLELPINLSAWKQRLNAPPPAFRAGPIRMPMIQPTTPLLGREPELEVLRALQARVITILGIGGIGKSRLALEFARSNGEMSFFVQLNAAQPDASLAAHIAQVLGLTLHGGLEPDFELRQALQVMDEPIRLVLDNVEHIVPAVIALCESLLLVPNLRLVVTSRQRLNIIGEHVVLLQGLAVPTVDDDPTTFASVRLVLTAAHRHGAHDHRDSNNLTAIAEIARIVQGVPLALELAASWLHFMTPTEIALELRRSWELLEDTTLQLPDRQSGLNAVFDSTWALMPQQQQRVLARLAVFEGGFDFAAAKAVAGADQRSIHRVMLQLMDWALLQRFDHGRFDLHPLIREYARQHLGDAEIVMGALKEHFSDLARRSHQLPPDALDEDIENMFLVWKTALKDRDQPALEVLASPFFEVLFRLGRLLELRAQLEAAFEITARTNPAEQQEQIAQLGLTAQSTLQRILQAWQIEMHHHLRGTTKPALEPDQLLPHLEREGLLFELAFTHHNMGLANFEAHHYPEALEHFEASLKYGRQIPYPYWDIVVLSNTALLYRRQDNQSAARRILQDLLETAVVQNDQNSLASVNNLIGELEYANAHWETAKAHFVKAEHFARISKTTRVHALILENLGWVAVQHSDIAQAIRDFTNALQQFRASGDMIGVGHAYCGLAHAQQIDQRFEDARLNRLKGLRIAQEVGAVVIVNRCLRHWLPTLKAQRPQLANTLQKCITADDRMLEHLPALIAFLEQPGANVMT